MSTNPYDRLLAGQSIDHNRYDKLLDDQKNNQRQALRRAMLGAVDVNPDEYAKAIKLSRKTGIPAPVVHRNMDEVKRVAASNEYDQLLNSNPQLAKFLIAKGGAPQVAHDDTGPLSGIENAAKTAFGVPLKTLGGMANRAYTDTMLAASAPLIGADKAISATTGTRSTGLEDWWFKNIVQPRADAQKDFALGPNAGIAAKVLSGLTQGIGLFAETALSGGDALPEAAFKSSDGALTYLRDLIDHSFKTMAVPATLGAVDTARSAESHGATPTTGLNAALASYLAMSLAGSAPMGLEGHALKRTLSGALSGLLTSEIMRRGQNLVLPPGLRQPFHASDAIANALQFGLMGAAFGPRPFVDSVKAMHDAEHLKTIMHLSRESATRKRDAQTFGEFMQTLPSEEQPAHVFVRAKDLANVADKAGVNPETISPIVKAQLKDALKTDGDLSLPLSDVAQWLPGSSMEQSLLPHLKTDPEGMSQAQAHEFLQSAAQELADAADKAKKEHAPRSEFRRSAKAVNDIIKGQLNDAAQFHANVNKTYTSLMSAMYTTTADRLGITPEELLNRYPLRIVGENGTGAPDYTQPGGEDHRGSIQIGSDIKHGATIRLSKNADLTTFIHESGHFWLEVMHDIAAGGKAPGVSSDMDTVLKWFGVKGETPEQRLANWNHLDAGGKRQAHEQFARGMEHYLMEGKAPSLALGDVFARVKAWMAHVYRNLASLNVPMTDEVRGVFGRLMASDAAIAEAQAAQGYFEIPRPEGVSDAEWQAYRSAGAQATHHALRELHTRSLRDMQWLDNAKSKALRKAQSAARHLRAGVRKEVIAQVDAMPVYKAERFIKRGEIVSSDGELTKVDGPHHLNIDAVRRLYHGDENAPDWRKLGTGNGGLLRTQGIDPQLVAEQFGYDSADAMIRDLLNRQPRGEAIAGLTDKAMLEQHGEYSSPEDIARQADLLIHNDARARMMATGLKMLTKSPTPVRLLAQAAKDLAHRMVGDTVVKDLRPRKYLAAEARANRELLRKAPKDPAGAAEAQRAALLNNRLTRAALEAQSDLEKGLSYLKKFSKKSIRTRLDPDVLEQIDDLLNRFELRLRPPAEEPAHMMLREWLEAQKALGYTPLENADMLNPTFRTHYVDMTVDQFRALRDTVKSMEHIARERRRVTIENRKLDLQHVVNDLTAKMRERGEKFTDAQLAERPRHRVDPIWRITLDRLQSALRWTSADMKPQHFKANQFDQHQILGPFHRYIFEPIFSANYRYMDMRREISDRFAEGAKKLGSTWQKSLTEVVENHHLMDNALDFPAKRRLTRGDLIGIALHVGNESNFDKLTKGMDWDGAQVMQTLDNHMRREDWEAVKLLWQVADMHWEEMAAMNRRLGNTMPEKVEARPFMTKYGEMPGGYAPVRYDPIRSRFAARKVDARAVNPAEGLFARDYYRADTTTNGSLNARIAGYHDFVDLDWHATERAIHDGVRDLAYREALVSTHKILANSEFRQQFMRTYGREQHDALLQWLGQLVNADVGDERTNQWVAFSRRLRRATVANGIAYRLSTIQKHGSSAFIKSLGYFSGGGEKYFLARLREVGLNHKKSVVEGLAKSRELRARYMQQDRDFSRPLGTMMEPENVHAKAERFGHVGVAFFDFLSAVPTFLGAYDMAITRGVPKRLGGTGKPMSEADAIKWADSVVREAHGTNIESGRSNLINTRSEWVRNLTILYNFMNNTLGQQMDMYDKAFHSEFGKPEIAARYMAAILVPAVAAAYLTEGGPHGEPWWKWVAGALGGEFSGMVPMVRDMYEVAVEGWDSAGLPPWMDAFKSMLKPVHDITTTHKVKHPIKDVGNAAGFFIPGLGQAGATTQFLVDVGRGDQRPQTVEQWLRGLSKGHAKPVH